MIRRDNIPESSFERIHSSKDQIHRLVSDSIAALAAYTGKSVPNPQDASAKALMNNPEGRKALNDFGQMDEKDYRILRGFLWAKGWSPDEIGKLDELRQTPPEVYRMLGPLLV